MYHGAWLAPHLQYGGGADPGRDDAALADTRVAAPLPPRRDRRQHGSDRRGGGQRGRRVERAVIAAAWAEAIAFYAFVTIREFRRLRAGRRASGAALLAVRDVVAEFGVAEAADTILLRPLLMYAMAATLGGLIPGVIAGKIVSDVGFYALAIPAYEFRERART